VAGTIPVMGDNDETIYNQSFLFCPGGGYGGEG
jgi:hypothetical protein